MVLTQAAELLPNCQRVLVGLFCLACGRPLVWGRLLDVDLISHHCPGADCSTDGRLIVLCRCGQLWRVVHPGSS